MLRHALRRILWTLPTLFVVSVVTFLVLTFVPDPVDDPRFTSALTRADRERIRRERYLDLPTFFNPAPRDVQARAMEAVRQIVTGGAEAARAATDLQRIGGAALPHVLPALDTLAPEPRTQVALALAPIARRMKLPRAEDAYDPGRAVAFWTRFWDDRGVEFRAASVRSAVQRFTRYGSDSRAAEILELDTFALEYVIGALVTPQDAAGVAQARALVAIAAEVTGIDDRISPTDDVQAAQACVARWKTFWSVYRGDYAVFSGPSRVAAMVLETRYGKWALGALTHRLGLAANGEPVLDELGRRAPVTLALVFGAIVLAYAVAIPLGVISAASRGRKTDLIIACIVLGMTVVPTAVLAVLAHPKGGAYGGSLLLPTALLAVALVAAPTRQQRSALATVLTQDVIRAAQARGASRVRALLSHGLRNTLLPVVTLAVVEPPLAIGGAFVVEHVFRLHGLGEATILAVQARDANWLMALSIFAAAVAALAVIATDLAYVLLDPRLASAVLSRRRRG
ncbi:ABC transporter permease [Chondromyces apiculatus]|uniref:Oligopeptide transport system permease protein OppB n=1 Tax=Chondromyces apiculatus DSM 436 TaxID=1192034 RepID=A0A017SZG9_9BACT|nr:ABC transporter permease [Chondromyces apiculatus]EYF01696.1 Oligopeptide transport system permease protein OppB [Chondromyces apiculatus DSM 436]